MEMIKEGYTRVSQILSIFQNYSHVPPAKLKKAQDTGTAIHEAIELFYRGEFIPIDPKIAPYFDSFMRWHNAFYPVIQIIEERFYYDDWMITGKIDLVCKISGETYLIDFKTGSWAHPEIWKLQSAFYVVLLESVYGTPSLHKSMFVQLKDDGTEPNIFEFERHDGDFYTCKAALHCYRFFQKRVDGNA